MEEKWVGKIGCQRVSRIEDLTVANPVSSGFFRSFLLTVWALSHTTPCETAFTPTVYTSPGHCSQLSKSDTESNDCQFW